MLDNFMAMSSIKERNLSEPATQYNIPSDQYSARTKYSPKSL
ncbi:MAG: hypothetical protein ACTSWG_07545 [Candidatus Helarchaeota archaeon]